MAIVGTYTVRALAKGVVLAQWTGITAVGAGVAFDGAQYPDKSVILAGTIGSGTTVLIEGSNTATNHLVTGGAGKFYTLTDQGDTALSLSTGKAEVILQNTKYVRPRITAANANTNVSVTIIASSLKR